MTDIGIKIIFCENIASIVKILRLYTSMSISEIKDAIATNKYVISGSGYRNEELDKLVDCYKKLKEAGVEAQIYKDGEEITLEMLLTLQQRNYEIACEVDAETELELDDTDFEEIEPYSYLWTEELEDWLVIKDEYDYTIYNKKTQIVLSVENEDLNNKIAAMLIMQGADVENAR